MISDINKIYVNSSVRINANTMPILCFVDGKAVDESLYSLVDNELNLYVETKEYVTLSYGYNDANVYNFNVVLNDKGVIIEKYDSKGSWLQNLKPDNFLVFVDGRLLESYEYEYISSEAIALKVFFKDDQFHNVIIYACKLSFEDGVITKACGETIECNYDRDRYLLFKNGYLIPNDHVYVSTGNESIIINYEYNSQDDVRYIVLPSSNQTINFRTEPGYLTYGPTDDYKKTVPLKYDYELVFDQNVINLIDDIRTGFILHSDEYNSEYLIIDNNFNKKNIKALSLNNDFNRYYTSKQYYLLVPENKKIIDYLNDFDKKGTIVPEVLEVFQRFLLDEYYDEVKRLRNIRNLSKVDSVHINKLLNLLGNKIDLRNKTLLQKRALLEELTSFYKKKGTKQAFNIFNTADVDIGLADLEQLFTIRNNAAPKTDKIISKIYIDRIEAPGQGYEIEKEYALQPAFSDDHSYSTNIKVKVNNVDDPVTGGVKSASLVLPETVSGVELQEGSYNLVSVGNNAKFNITSEPNYFDYELLDAQGEGLDQLPIGNSITCQTDGYPGIITFTKKTNGEIDKRLSIKSGSKNFNTRDPKTGELKFAIAGKIQDNIGATLHSNIIQADDYLFVNNKGSNSAYKLNLESGIYYYEMSGGGGSGGAADSTVGDTADIPSYRGSNGEYVTGLFYVPQATTIDIYVGGGAQPSYAKGHDTPRCGGAGAGYGNPQQGVALRQGWNSEKYVSWWQAHFGGSYYQKYGSGSIFHRYKVKVDEYDTIGTGSGGGASAIIIPNTDPFVARGGKGGDAVAYHYDADTVYKGGNGGGGYFSTESKTIGAAGGEPSAPDGSFTSKGGKDGWVKIKKCTVKYVVTLDTAYHKNAEAGSKYKTDFFSKLLPSSAYIEFIGDKKEVYNIVLDEKKFETKMNPDKSGEYIFYYDGIKWTYNGSEAIMGDYGVTYDGIPMTGDQFVVHYTMATKYNEFELVVTQYDDTRSLITGWDIEPKNGNNYFTYKNGKLLINDLTNGTDVPIVFYPLSSKIEVKIDSKATKYAYYMQLDEDSSTSTGYDEGDQLRFINNLDPQLQDFLITVDEVNAAGTITQFHYTPTSGKLNRNRSQAEASKDICRGAKVLVKVDAQTLADVQTIKEYVDFFNKEELGAVHKTEYRFPITDYGLVMEGTPNSPYPWMLGKSDEDFGQVTSDQQTIEVDKETWEKEIYKEFVSDGHKYRYSCGPQHIIHPPIAGKPTTLITVNWGERQDREYGYVKDAIKGKWYQWWEWERDPNYYPTNHIEVTLTPKNAGNAGEILERFFSQFYKIASTVLYIHRIILNYSFGNTTVYTKNNAGISNGAVLFGFMSGQPISYEKHYFDNDPERQIRI